MISVEFTYILVILPRDIGSRKPGVTNLSCEKVVDSAFFMENFTVEGITLLKYFTSIKYPETKSLTSMSRFTDESITNDMGDFQLGIIKRNIYCSTIVIFKDIDKFYDLGRSCALPVRYIILKRQLFFGTVFL